VGDTGVYNAFLAPLGNKNSTFGAQRASVQQQQRQEQNGVIVKYSDVETSDIESISNYEHFAQKRMVLRSQSKTVTKAAERNKNKAFDDGCSSRTVIPSRRYVVNDINERDEDSDACSRTVMSPRIHVVNQDNDACSATVSPRREVEDSEAYSRTAMSPRRHVVDQGNEIGSRTAMLARMIGLDIDCEDRGNHSVHQETLIMSDVENEKYHSGDFF